MGCTGLACASNTCPGTANSWLRHTLAILGAVLIAIGCLGSPASRAQAILGPDRDAIVWRGWLDDPDSSLTPQEALSREWTPFVGTLARGFTASTTWVRLRIDPAAAGKGLLADDPRLVLQWIPPHLDAVAVYRTDRPSQPPVLLGDRQPLDPGDHASVEHLVLDDATAPFEVLMKIRSQSNQSIRPQVLRWNAALRFEHANFTLGVAYLVFTGMLMVWGLILWAGERDSLVLQFVLLQGCALLVGASLLGVTRSINPVFVAVPVCDLVSSLSIPLIVFTTLRFHSGFLAGVGAPRVELMLIRACAWCAFGGLVLVALGWVRAGLQTTQAMIPIGNVLSLLAACRIPRATSVSGLAAGAGGKAYLVFLYLLMAFTAVPQSARVLGLVPSGIDRFGGYLVYSIASSFLLGAILVVRIRDSRAARRREELALLQSRQELSEQRALAAEQSELVAMLAHELKTPLAVVNLALESEDASGTLTQRALRAVNNMRHVIDRCDQAARLDDEMAHADASARLQPVLLQDVLFQVVNAEMESDRIDCPETPDLPPCLAEPQLLRLICTNLIENALKYSPKNSPVSVALAQHAAGSRPGLLLVVSNGVGDAGQPDPHQVFAKFYRSASARAMAGSGLGLYLCRRAADRMGADLSLDPSVPGTVSFRLWVPCAPVPGG